MTRDELRRCLRAIADAGPIPVPGETISSTCREAIVALDADKIERESPVPLIIHCPMCHSRHVDEGEQATRPHRTHACQNPRCGHLWAPAVVATVGVWTLPGCLNESRADAAEVNVYGHTSACDCDAGVHDPRCRTFRGIVKTWDGVNARLRPCPTCGVAVGVDCTRAFGAPPMTVGDGDGQFHESRCWRITL